MKIKTDFVTNSSSSSFVVFFEKKIEKEQDLIDMGIELRFIKQIFKDCQKQAPIKLWKVDRDIVLQIIDEIEGGDLPGVPDVWNYESFFCKEHDITMEQFNENPEWNQQMWQEFRVKRNQAALIEAKRLIKKHEGKYVYFFEYADNGDSFFSALEHENNWGGQEYVKINKH